MRVGNALAALLDASQPQIFGADVGPTDLLPEEAWHPACLPPPPAPANPPAQAGLPDQATADQSAAEAREGGGAEGACDADSLKSETDSDDDSIGSFEIPPEEDKDGSNPLGARNCSLAPRLLWQMFTEKHYLMKNTRIFTEVHSKNGLAALSLPLNILSYTRFYL